MFVNSVVYCVFIVVFPVCLCYRLVFGFAACCGLLCFCARFVVWLCYCWLWMVIEVLVACGVLMLVGTL